MQAFDNFITNGAVVETVNDAFRQFLEIFQLEFVVFLFIAENEDDRQAAFLEILAEGCDILHGVCGGFAALVQKAEDVVVATYQQFGTVFLATFGVGEVTVGVEAADDLQLVVGFAQNEVDRSGFIRFDGEELAEVRM